MGEGVTRWTVGSQVCALVAGGGYATLCVAPEAQCLPVPAHVDLVAAAAIPETFFTVWSNVFDRGRLKAGEQALFHGGSSGIGTTAIQLAAARGARVFATAGSDEKCRACERLGARRAINYRQADFADEILLATDGSGADVILDMVGGSYVEKNIRCAAKEGRIVSIAFLQGSKIELDLLPMMLKRLTLTGSTLRPRTVEEKASICRALENNVWPLIAQGEIKPQIFRTFPLAEAASAHALMESSEHIGKIVLVP